MAADDPEPEPESHADVVLSLPYELRTELKEPMGPVYTEADDLLAEAGDPIVAVGDVVTYHLLRADRRPDVALVDGKTKREAVEATVWAAIDGFDHRIEVTNPQATLSADLLTELRAALERAGAGDGETTVLVIEGEEDLAALPVLAAAPDGASLVYGQPDEGMVLAAVTAEAREGALSLLSRMDGDPERPRDLLGLDRPD
jgi:uncharacterized protein (UPF0218 family)